MEYPDLVDPFRKLGLASKRPFVIENVPNAPIRKDLLLCGTMFEDFGDSINVFRHRVFEIHGFSARQPGHTNHQVMGVKGVNSGGKVECVYGQKGPKGKNGRERWMKAMSLDKYDNFYLPYKDERGMMEHGISSLWSLKEAIPPQYTCYIMKEFVRCWNNGKTRLVH